MTLLLFVIVVDVVVAFVVIVDVVVVNGDQKDYAHRIVFGKTAINV